MYNLSKPSNYKDTYVHVKGIGSINNRDVRIMVTIIIVIIVYWYCVLHTVLLQCFVSEKPSRLSKFCDLIFAIADVMSLEIG